MLLLAQAGAAEASSPTGTTQANVHVTGAITLSNLTPSFTLIGTANTTVTLDDAVTMTVQTNNPTGYQIAVQPAAANLQASSTPASIPVTDMSARETGAANFAALSSTSALVLYSQNEPSQGVNGDQRSNDYQINIPNAFPDTYSVTLDYVAVTT